MPVEATLLETLLWSCFEGPNQCSPDEGLHATITTPPVGASVLAFSLDRKTFRAASGLDEQGKKCCDRLLLVAHKPIGEDPRLTFFLIELKGRNIEHALAQLGDTADVLREKFSRGRTRFIAVIVSDRMTASLSKSEMEQFRKRHRASIFLRSGIRNEAPTDLSDLVVPQSTRGHSHGQTNEL